IFGGDSGAQVRATSLVSARGHGSTHAKLAGLGSPLGTRSGSTGRRRRSGRLSLRPILPMMALKQAELGTRVDRNRGRSKQESIETGIDRDKSQSKRVDRDDRCIERTQTLSITNSPSTRQPFAAVIGLC